VDAARLWKSFREHPFIVFVTIVVEDSLRLAVVWTLLYAFHFLPRDMPIPGLAGSLIEYVHQAGSVVVAFLLVWFLVIDVVQSHRQKLGK
jgi:hypothetical protein